MKQMLEKLKDIFSLHCPECGGRLKCEMIDMELDKLVYQCIKCEKEWI